MPWTVIVPMSPLDRAKTRLADASSSPSRHRALVRAMRRDTVRAVLGAVDAAADSIDAMPVVVADLPALTASALDRVLDAAQTVDLGVVLDRQGMGTTMLTARPGHQLCPRFGPGSARRHAEIGAARIAAPLPARTDVDVVDDLDAAQRLGFGPDMRTLPRIGELPLPPPRRRD